MASQLETAFDERKISEDRVRNFAADASHELRTPLAAILGYAELYRQGGIPAGEPLDRAVTRIESEGTRMLHLVEDLLLIARLDQEHQLEVREVDLGLLLSDTIHNATASDPESVVTLRVDDDVRVTGDERRLRQVFDNLVANAIQHTPSGTPITVHLTETAQHAIIDTIDEGPGIPNELRSRVFDRFYRGDRTRIAGASTSGTGLGLSIVDGLVRAHNGTVTILDHEGSGTTVRVMLPERADIATSR